MDFILISILLAFFMVILFFTLYFENIPLAVLGVIFCLILGGICLTDDIEIKSGSVCTLSTDGESITNLITYEKLNPIYQNGFILSFFIFAIYFIWLTIDFSLIQTREQKRFN